MQRITPFLWFEQNNAEEAMNYYVSIFPNSKVLRVTRYPEGGPAPAGTVMTVDAELDGQQIVGLNGGPHDKFNWAVSFVVNCETQEEVDHYWEKLSADGGEKSRCGWVKDKFGLWWQVTPNILTEAIGAKDPEKAARVMQAMMKMDKIEIEPIRQAYSGD